MGIGEAKIGLGDLSDAVAGRYLVEARETGAGRR